MGGRFSAVCIDNEYQLVILNCEMEDQAEYTIVAEEGVESTAKLTVEGK